ncbi:M4 family metallopeptidase [Catellatospora sp. NPDC049609]|uniref:M4 family metallopeptidase n=1 Tax=Catellatospora sp. NPDC049609 TaxID=3155505 RepID=UPI003417615F
MSTSRRPAFPGLTITLAAALVTGGLVLPVPAAAEPPAPTATVHRDAAGRVRAISPAAGKTIRPETVGGRPVTSPEGAARAHLDRYASLFGVRDAARELAPPRTELQAGVRILHFPQVRAGLPVIGGQLNVQLAKDGSLLGMNGETTTAGAFAGTARITAAAAQRTAVAGTAKAARVEPRTLTASKPVLSAYDPALVDAVDVRGARAVWQLEVRSRTDREIRQYVLVNADDGRVALSFSQTAHANGARTVCDFGNVPNSTNACPGGAPVARAEGQGATGVTDVDAAYQLSGAFRDFLTSMGRNSIDNAGKDLVSAVNFCPNTGSCPYPNAFWDGGQLTYGAGYASADDVVGHEFTHGITEYTSKLLYYSQSGAINESISDVLGEAFDQVFTGTPAGNDTPAAKWLLGEDIPGGAIRNMSHPPAMNQPDATDSPLWHSHPYDNAGVHINSGVGNKTAYLMNDGGTFGGFTIKPIGDVRKTARIWLAAEGLLTPGSDYSDLAYALHQACINLTKDTALGITDQHCLSVLYATGATKMSTKPVADGPIPQAPQCAAPAASTNVLFDNFNWPASGSLFTGWSESGAASIDGSARPSHSAGNALYIPDPYPDAARSTHWVARSAYLQLPATGPVYAHFNHHYSFDYTVNDGTSPLAHYDGGRVLIQVEGSTAWTPLTSGWVNGPTKTLFDFSGKWFGGDSLGWVSSRVDLTAYQGRKVKLRFEVQTDGVDPISAAYGWWIDNLRVYNCSGKRPLTNDINGDGFGDLAIGEPGRPVSGQPAGGAIRTMFGTSTGPHPLGNQLYTQDNAFVQGASAPNGNFGAAVTTADTNADGYADVLAGAPDSPSGEGSVTVMRGTVWGLTAQLSKSVSASSAIPGTGPHRFGAALAAGDFNGDGFGDVAVGAPGNSGNRGGVKVLYGAAAGLASTGAGVNWFTQDTGAVPDTAEDGDQFGAALAAGDFNGDGRTDLAVGAPGETIGTATGTGSVTILLGSPSGITATGSQAFDQDTANMPETGESGDQFGFALGAGDVTGDGKADLAVGAPGEDVDTSADSGAAFLIRGAATGLTATASQVLFDRGGDLLGAGDRWGTAVTVGDLNADRFADVVVAAPYDDWNTVTDVGGLTVLRGNPDGLAISSLFLSQARSCGWSGLPECPMDEDGETGDQFGSVLLATKIRNSSKADLIVGVPFEDNGTSYNEGVLHVMPVYGTDTTVQTFTPSGMVGGGLLGTKFGGGLG